MGSHLIKEDIRIANTGMHAGVGGVSKESSRTRRMACGDMACSPSLYLLSNNLARQRRRRDLPPYECRIRVQREFWQQPAREQGVSMKENGIRQRG